MKIGLLSDTHGYLDEKIFTHFAQCDEVWHAGDIGNMEVVEKLVNFKPFRAVYGNIDGQEIRSLCPEHLKFTCEGFKIWMTHIGGYPPRYNPRVLEGLKKATPDIFICGHSHILKIMTDPKRKNMLYINPGAAGRYGFHKVKTLVRFDLLEKKISNMQVIELGRRV